MKLVLTNDALKEIYKDVATGDENLARIMYNTFFNKHEEEVQPYQKLEVLETIEDRILQHIHKEFQESMKKWR